MHKCMAELAQFHSGKTAATDDSPSAKTNQDLLKCTDVVTSAGTYALRRQMSTVRREERPSLL